MSYKIGDTIEIDSTRKGVILPVLPIHLAWKFKEQDVDKCNIFEVSHPNYARENPEEFQVNRCFRIARVDKSSFHIVARCEELRRKFTFAFPSLMLKEKMLDLIMVPFVIFQEGKIYNRLEGAVGETYQPGHNYFNLVRIDMDCRGYKPTISLSGMPPPLLLEHKKGDVISYPNSGLKEILSVEFLPEEFLALAKYILEN